MPGATANEVTWSGCKVRVAEAGLFNVPVIITGVCEVTGDVINENVPVVWPAGMGTLEETNITRLRGLLESCTTAGVVGAVVRVTVPVTVCAPSAVVGLTVTD